MSKGVVFFMKKFLVLICLVVLVSLSGLAFAEAAGYINNAAVVKTERTFKYEPRIYTLDLNNRDENDVVVYYTDIKSILPNVNTPEEFKAANIYLPTSTANEVVVMTNVKMNIIRDLSPTMDLRIEFRNYTDTNTTKLFAFIKARSKSGHYPVDMYHAFECTLVDEILKFKVDYPEDFFEDFLPENTVIVATVKTVDTGGSGGGCNAGYAGLLLFAAVPFFFRKKK